MSGRTIFISLAVILLVNYVTESSAREKHTKVSSWEDDDEDFENGQNILEPGDSDDDIDELSNDNGDEDDDIEFASGEEEISETTESKEIFDEESDEKPKQVIKTVKKKVTPKVEDEPEHHHHAHVHKLVQHSGSSRSGIEVDVDSATTSKPASSKTSLEVEIQPAAAKKAPTSTKGPTVEIETGSSKNPSDSSSTKVEVE